MLEDFNASCELLKIIKHFFPDLIPSLKQVNDPRNKSYIKYESHVILFMRILSVVFHIGSMRGITAEFNKSTSIKNITGILNAEKLKELPHWKTINDYLERFENSELENIIQKLVSRLIRMRSFECSRIRNKYWHIVVDATGLCSFDERHCPHCLTKEHKNKDGSVQRTEYYHSVLEAKLVINGNIVISIATEFIENEEKNPSKQDCELKAFARLAKKLKRSFPRLSICLGMDSLYACKTVFDICKQNNWHYIIRFKAGSIPSVGKEFNALKTMEPDQTFTTIEINKTKTVEISIIKTYTYVKDILYQGHTFNIVEYTGKESEKDSKKHLKEEPKECTKEDPLKKFVFLTDLPICKKNCEQLVEDGRRRWKIENEGFNTQKHHGYEIEHLFSENYNAMKNHYLLIQIGHMIDQLFINAPVIWKLIKSTQYKAFEELKESFKTTVLDFEKNFSQAKRGYYQFI